MFIVVTLKMDEAPETIEDLAKAKGWQIHAIEKTKPTVDVNRPPGFGEGYAQSSIPTRR